MNIYFKENLKFLRAQHGVSQLKLAKLIDTSQSTICKWEKGKIEPDLHHLAMLANYFHTSLESLIFEDLKKED